MSTMSFTSYLQHSASFCTILQFLSPIWPLSIVVRQANTGSLSPLQYVVGFLSCSTWLRYGWLVDDPALIYVNILGSFLFFIYTVVFWIYSTKKLLLVKQALTVAVVECLTAYYSWIEKDTNAVRENVGLLCLVLTITFFASPLDQLALVIRSKSTECLSFLTIFATFVVTLQWFVYGIVLHDFYIQIPNCLGALLSGFMLLLFCIYPNHSPISDMGGKLFST